VKLGQPQIMASDSSDKVLYTSVLTSGAGQQTWGQLFELLKVNQLENKLLFSQLNRLTTLV
jgi:hypothetical protein